MIPESSIVITDLNYIDYHYKQWKELTYEHQVYKANNVKVANNFSYEKNAWNALPYYGFGMISMLNQNEKNFILSGNLVKLQEKIMFLMEEKTDKSIQEKIFLLPEQSFHQTIANALSNTKYDSCIIEKDLENIFPKKLNKILSTYNSLLNMKTLRMKMIGLGIFGNAIGLLGVFDDPFEYNSIIQFRDYFYNNEVSKNIGIQKTRPFIGHITLAYIESDLTLLQKSALVEVTTAINQEFQNEKHFFYLDFAQLTRFENLAYFEIFENSTKIYF